MKKAGMNKWENMSPKKAHPKQTDFKQQIEGNGHQHHVQCVRGGCQNCGNDGKDYNGLAAMPCQAFYVNGEKSAQQHHSHRHLENQAKTEEKQGAKGDEFAHRNKGFYIRRLKAE